MELIRRSATMTVDIAMMIRRSEAMSADIHEVIHRSETCPKTSGSDLMIRRSDAMSVDINRPVDLESRLVMKSRSMDRSKVEICVFIFLTASIEIKI